MKYDTNDSLKVPEKNNRKLGGAIYEIDIKSVKVKKKQSKFSTISIYLSILFCDFFRCASCNLAIPVVTLSGLKPILSTKNFLNASSFGSSHLSSRNWKEKKGRK